MTRPCEVCSGLLQWGELPAPRRRRMRRVVMESRIVALCDEHADAVRESGVATVEELRTLFLEPVSGRSYVDRRSPLDRRVFPPRPEGRRRTQGRRTSDPVS